MAAMNSVLEPGSKQMPTCMCGHEMRLRRTDPHPAAEDTEVRRYNCATCDHEMRVMVFKSLV
jgi:hypothetical protein